MLAALDFALPHLIPIGPVGTAPDVRAEDEDEDLDELEETGIEEPQIEPIEQVDDFDEDDFDDDFDDDFEEEFEDDELDSETADSDLADGSDVEDEEFDDD